MIGEDNILTLTYHDFTTSWCMKINLYEVFCGIEYRELPDYEPDLDEVKITLWQRIKKIIQLIKKHGLVYATYEDGLILKDLIWAYNARH